MDYSLQRLKREAAALLDSVRMCKNLEQARERLYETVTRHQFDTFEEETELSQGRVVRVRDCSRALRGILKSRSDSRTGFSVARVFWDISRDTGRPDLSPAFWAELTHLVEGLEGRAPYEAPGDYSLSAELTGREAALERTKELDRLWARAERWMSRYEHGLTSEARERRKGRRREILAALGGSESDWHRWQWQVTHGAATPEQLSKAINLSERERECVRRVCDVGIPFRVTPFYLSLMDREGSLRDASIRAQVLPPPQSVDEMVAHRGDREWSFDFMLEHDTSPVDLVTRRYAGVAILKPCNACPQICVYCQRNWEVDRVIARKVTPPGADLDQAISWLEEHPSIGDVLVTGGDPFLMGDAALSALLKRLAALPTVRRIRLGTRTPVTLPMRITPRLARMLARFRVPGEREVVVVTHVQHPYEVNEDMITAVERLKRQGISVYNQLVYTFYVSRRFEAALLRILLRRIGIDPYYTFLPKGKDETAPYRVPMARLLQEQKEEARLLPGLDRTDEAVYNVPRLGKNYLRAVQHRDLLTILPDGTRVYEFHPWEKNVVNQQPYVGRDLPILTYLARLEDIGENAGDYTSIWYYF